MKRFLKPMIFLLVLAAIWLLAFPTAWLHYKLSVDVDDNGTLRHGEGVIYISFQSQGPLLIGNTPQWTVDAAGEAFAVDLGPHGVLFVLLSADPRRKLSAAAGRGALGEYFKFYVNDLPNGLGSLWKIIAFAGSKMNVRIATNQLPRLVWFRDLNDPNSAEFVDPDRLDSNFGSGVKIANVRAELTSEPTTTGIEKRLTWVNNPKIVDYPAWSTLSPQTKEVIGGLFSGAREAHFK